MIDLDEKNAAIFVLLMRARKAWDKSEGVSTEAERKRLTDKAIELQNDAETVDPGRECKAWADHLNGTHPHA
jgi:hypothetical protein